VSGETATRIVTVRRRTSGTPLARQHEHLLAGRSTRKIAAIPWERFDRARYPEAALALAAHAQRALASGEYSAINLFARLASALAVHGAPLDIITAAARIPSDEARHADYALRLASLCAGADVGFEVDPDAVAAAWSKPLELEDVDFLMLEVSAIGETLAGALLAACQERATDPVARALFTAILGDEVHHARLGWYYFAWRAPQWSRAERQRAADRAAVMIVNAEPTFWHGRDAAPPFRKAARALGVLDSPGQRRALKRSMEQEIVPALDALGLGASHAWRARRRGDG
jgi:hypothetical protein